jgi:hypothetical protein
MKITKEDFLLENGSLLIPKALVPFVGLREIPEKRICKNCGLEFYPRHRSQFFCPVEPGIKRSRCENTFNQRIKRQRRKEREKQDPFTKTN